MVNSLDKLYAKKLRTLRLKKDFLQKNLASALELESQQDYSKLERGNKHFTDNIIKKICTIFKITETEFKRISVSECEVSDSEDLKDNLITSQKHIIKLLEEKSYHSKLIELYKTKDMLEKELALTSILILEKVSKKHVFYHEERKKYYICTFL